MAIDMELRGELASQGFAFCEIKNLQQQPKATYYKADGTPLPNLPADPRSMKRYLARGFTLAPPNGTLGFVCDICGQSGFKARIALAGHRRKHKKE